MDYTESNINGNAQISICPDGLKTLKNKRDICGAKTRKGTPCNAPPVWNKVTDKAKNGRCKLHGGLSTGAKTAAGRLAIRDGVRDSNRRRGKQNQEITKTA